jgi:hypothetical protein
MNPEKLSLEMYDIDRIIRHHGFNNWVLMGDSVHKLVGGWNGILPYEHYSKWYDIYYSDLQQALTE